jgi:hypothetical protein
MVRDGSCKDEETGMDGYARLVSSAWDFAAAHPFVCAWLAVSSAWAIFTVAGRDRA